MLVGIVLGGGEGRLEEIEQNFNTLSLSLSLLIMSPFELSTSAGRAFAPD